MADAATHIPFRHQARAKQYVYRITLTCGCAVNMRNKPMNPATRYPCRSNMGHGYRLLWASCSEPGTGIVRTNPMLDREDGEREARKHMPNPVAETEMVPFDQLATGDRIHFATQAATAYTRTWRDGTVGEFSGSGNSFKVQCDDGSTSQINRNGYGNRMVKRYM